MKKTLNIFVLVAALMVMQACGSKSEKDSEASAVTEADETSAASTETPAITEEAVLTPAEKKAKIERETVVLAEKRRIAFEERAKITPTYKDEDGNVVYNKAEVDPSFTGGKKAMAKYLNDNIKFPKEAEDTGKEGTVFVDFIVGADGTVREVGVTDTPGEEADLSFRKEAIRVVTAMPKWVPGRQRGKAVQVKFSLPIAFEMI